MKPNGSKPLVIIQCYEDRQQTLALRKSAPPVYSNGDARASAEQPPPPPPMPIAEDTEQKPSDLKNGFEQKPTNLKNGFDPKSSNARNGSEPKLSYLKNGHNKTNGVNGNTPANLNGTNGTLKRTPTPDYESANIETLTAKLKLKTHPEETAEVDSIESYKMRNPSSPQPKPPSTYFMRPPNGTATTKKTARPVSITIGEYPSRTIRKQPSKLEFLNGDNQANGEIDSVPLGSRLQSELAMTLSRSNLRKKTELLAIKLDSNGKAPVDNDISKESEQAQDTNFHKRYGNNMLPTPPQISIPKVPVVKTNSHVVSQHIAMLAGKVTANDERQDGILKGMPVNKPQDNRKKISFD